MMDTPDPKPKRKPGRPPKTNKTNISRLGKVDKPVNDNDIYEIIVDISELYKDIANICKVYKIDQVMVIHLKELTIFVIESEQSLFEKIEMTIHAEKCYMYYVRKPISYYLSVLELGKLFESMKKTDTGNISWYSNNTKDTCFIIECIDNNIKSETTKTICRDRIKMSVTTGDLVDYEPIRDDKYDINFKLPSNLFKNKLSTISKVTDSFTFEKINDKNLCLKYSSKTNAIENITDFENENLIDFKICVDKERIITMPLNISDIEQYISLCLSDYINIKFKGNDIILTYMLYDGLATAKMKMTSRNYS
jgi:hypothetical protein